MSIRQITLTGEQTDAERKRPSTMIWCDECDAPILRSKRYDHEHDLDGAMAYEKAKVKKLDDKIPDHAHLDTKTYEVTFHYEVVETIRVEASHKAEAKREAEQVQTFDGEYMETLHTEKRPIGDASPASIEYLEDHALLPDDHDVTQEDLNRLMETTEK